MKFFEDNISAENGYIIYNNTNMLNNINMLVFKIMPKYNKNGSQNGRKLFCLENSTVIKLFKR